MARSRIVKPGFRRNKALAKCDAHARLLFISIWMEADRDGRLKYIPFELHGLSFPWEPEIDIEKLIGQLVAGGFILRYTADGSDYIEVVNFAKHQHIHRDEKSTDCPPPTQVVAAQDTGEKPESIRSQPGEKPESIRRKTGVSPVSCEESPRPSSSSSPSPSSSPSDRLNISTSTIVDDPKSEAPPQHREVDLILKSLRFMISRSRNMQAEFMKFGDLEKKVTDWSGRVRKTWIIFCMGRVWSRYRDGDDGLNDPFADLEKPLAYLYTVIFPREFGRDPTFDDGKWFYEERHPVEWWYRTFFEKDIEERGR